MSLGFIGSPCLAVETAGDEDSSLPSFDILRLRYESQDTLDFDNGGIGLDSSRYSLSAVLSAPIDLGGDWRIVPFANYRVTTLDFDNLAPGAVFEDQDLHQASLHGVLYHQSADSPWIYGAWGRASFSSDTQDIDSDDFFFDLALGAGYKFSDDLTFGFGVAGLELGGDSRVLPGPMFFWKPCEDVSMSLIGAIFTAKWQPSDDWGLALRGAPYGSTWNVNDDGVSKDYDLSAYALRLHAERRITDSLWLSVGVGYTFASEFEVRDTSDDRLFKDDLDGGLSFSVGMSLRTW